MSTDNKDTQTDIAAHDHGNDSLKYLFTFLGGLAAGVALGLYLNSKQGKKIRKQVKQRMSALELEINDKVQAAMEEINHLAEKGGIIKDNEDASNK